MTKKSHNIGYIREGVYMADEIHPDALADYNEDEYAEVVILEAYL